MTRITRNRATKDSDKVVGRDCSNSPTGNFCAVDLALKTLVYEEAPVGRLDTSHSGTNPAGGQHGKLFFALGNRKTFRNELLRVKSQAHYLVGGGPRRTQGGPTC